MHGCNVMEHFKQKWRVKRVDLYDINLDETEIKLSSKYI